MRATTRPVVAWHKLPLLPFDESSSARVTFPWLAPLVRQALSTTAAVDVLHSVLEVGDDDSVEYPPVTFWTSSSKVYTEEYDEQEEDDDFFEDDAPSTLMSTAGPDTLMLYISLLLKLPGSSLARGVS